MVIVKPQEGLYESVKCWDVCTNRKIIANKIYELIDEINKLKEEKNE